MIFRIIAAYEKVLINLLKILMFVLLLSVLLQILGRYVPFIPRYLWTEEVARFSLIWVISIGSMIGVRENRHFFVDLLPRHLSDRSLRNIRILFYIFMYFISFIFIIFGHRFFMMGYIQNSEMTGMNLGFIYISVPLSGFTWAVFLSENFYREFILKQK